MTPNQLKKIAPTANSEIINDLAPLLEQAFEDYELNTPLRQAHFLAQAAHESGGFRTMIENLNYSASGLSKTFPKYFRGVNTANYARNPEKIANRVYANRMGNGPESSGDGWKYRGRGIFQLTGKSNYELMTKRIHDGYDDYAEVDLVSDPDKVTEVEFALITALEYWEARNLNPLADDDDVEGITRKINGGTNGLDEREAYLERAKAVLGAN